MTLFDPGPPEEPTEKLSADRRRTIRQRAMIARNLHPATRVDLRAETEETCGSCVHCHARSWRDRTYYKCDLVAETAGPATDIRISWPACSLWWPPDPDWR